MSMINHTDMQSEISKSRIYPFIYDNTFKKTILEPSNPKPQSQISNQIDFIFDMELQKFEFKPKIEKRTKNYKINLDSWQKSIIQEFKRVC